MMEWIQLDSSEVLEEASASSRQNPVLLFKHSTSCSISRTALNRLERNWKNTEDGQTKAYYLDLLSHRKLSHDIADRFNVEHQSPQVLILKNEKAVYNSSHFDIDYSVLRNEIEKAKKP